MKKVYFIVLTALLISLATESVKAQGNPGIFDPKAKLSEFDARLDKQGWAWVACVKRCERQIDPSLPQEQKEDTCLAGCRHLLED